MGLVGSINQVYQIKAMGSNFTLKKKKSQTPKHITVNDDQTQSNRAIYFPSKNANQGCEIIYLLHIQTIPINQTSISKPLFQSNYPQNLVTKQLKKL